MVRNWCITWQGEYLNEWLSENGIDHPDEIYHDIGRLFFKLLPDSLKYGVFQFEKGSTGTLHVQGYFEFRGDMRLTTLQRLLPSVHLEKRLGSSEQARDYCMDAAKRFSRFGPWVFGVFTSSGQGHRSDIDDLHKDLKAGKSDKYIFEEHFALSLRYHKGIAKYRSVWAKHRYRITMLDVIIGAPGVGKTRMIDNLYPKAYWKDGSQWWEGYNGETTIVFDEFVGNMPLSSLNRLCGAKTKLQHEVKGSHVPILAVLVIIISNSGPEHWWDWAKMKIPQQAFVRRINQTALWTTTSGMRWMDGIDREAWFWKCNNEDILFTPSVVT